MSESASPPPPTPAARPGHQVVRTPPRRPIIDLDGLPFVDRGLIDITKYRDLLAMAPACNVITFYATRGCPYRCAYCHRLWPKKARFRSAESLFEEIRRYTDIGFRRFSFVDDIFNVHPRRGAALFERIIKERLDLQLFFPNGIRGDILTPDWIDLMVEAGTVRVVFALESAVPRIQELMGKRLKVDHFKRNLDHLTQRHPQVVVDMFMIAGFPTETLDEVKETLDFAMSVKWLSRPILHHLIIYPGTQMEELALRHGVSREAMRESLSGEYYSLPKTLPFDTLSLQRLRVNLFRSYIMNKERIRHVLWQQHQHFTEAEILETHMQGYFRFPKSYDELLDHFGITREEIGVPPRDPDEFALTPEIMQRFQEAFPRRAAAGGFRILLLDVSSGFSEEDMTRIGVEQPLGLMSILTYLNQQLGDRIDGRIAKARVDFCSFDEMEALVDEFQPQLVGVRSLSVAEEMHDETLARLRERLPEAIIVAGGPHATSSLYEVAANPAVDVVVDGEGEVTFAELVEAILNHGGRLPEPEALKQIAGLAFSCAA